MVAVVKNFILKRASLDIFNLIIQKIQFLSESLSSAKNNGRQKYLVKVKLVANFRMLLAKHSSERLSFLRSSLEPFPYESLHSLGDDRETLYKIHLQSDLNISSTPICVSASVTVS